jgi:hypothetical protein
MLVNPRLRVIALALNLPRRFRSALKLLVTHFFHIFQATSRR